MAKFKLEAGMQLDLLTRAEVAEELRAWHLELVRGVTFRRFAILGQVTAGAYTVQDGPAAGMVWAVTRLAVSGSGIVAGTDTFSVYVNDVAATNLVASGLLRQKEWDPPVLIIPGGNELVVTGAGTGAGVDVIVSGAAVEVPESIAWQLL